MCIRDRLWALVPCPRAVNGGRAIGGSSPAAPRHSRTSLGLPSNPVSLSPAWAELLAFPVGELFPCSCVS
eukprot:7167371-Alexandrium_andersonii.AAC.1